MELDYKDYKELVEKIKNTKIKELDDAVQIVHNLNRIIFLGGEIEPGIGCMINTVISFWNKIDDELGIPVKERKPITIRVDSPGGELTDGFMIVDAISNSKTPVHTLNIGMAYSSALLAFVAGHKRLAYKHSSFLLHEGSAGFAGDTGKFQNFSSFYKVQLGQLKDIILKHSLITPELYEDKRRDDWWMTADEAKELGIVDQIVGEDE